MPTFRYTAFVRSGGIESGEISASSATDAVGLLGQRGRTVVEIIESAKTFAPTSAIKLATAQLAELARELATLLEAEIPIDSALKIAGDGQTVAKSAAVARALHDDVRSGAQLSQSVRQRLPTAPPYVAPLLRAGEERGALGRAMAEVAKLLEARAAIDARVRAALTYPALLAVIALVTLFIVTAYLFPALMGAFEGNGIEPPLVMRLSRSLGAVIDAYWPFVLACAGILSAVVLVGVRRMAARGTLDRMSLKAPLIGPIRRHMATAVLARTLGLLLGNGVGLVEAMRITADAVPARTIAIALRSAADRVRQGARLAAALSEGRVLLPAALQLVSIGEETGRVDALLLHVSGIAEREALRRIERTMTLLSPAITVLVGLIVGGIVLSVMQAILSVNSLAVR